MALHVFGHVEAQQLHAHHIGQLPRDLGLADAGGPAEQETADRLDRIAQAAARHADRRGQRVDGLVLAEDHRFQVAVEALQRIAVVHRNGLRRNARDLGDDFLDLVLADDALLLGLGQDFLRRAGLVDDVDGLVRQMPVVDEPRRELRRGAQRRRLVLDAVVLLEAGLQPLQDRTVSATVGSVTSIFWKRRDSAWSFSNTPRYSL